MPSGHEDDHGQQRSGPSARAALQSTVDAIGELFEVVDGVQVPNALSHIPRPPDEVSDSIAPYATVHALIEHAAAQIVHRFTLRDIEMIMLLSIQAGLLSDTAPGGATGAEGLRNDPMQIARGPMNEERCMWLLTATHRMTRRCHTWDEQVAQAHACTQALGIMLDVVSHERHEARPKEQGNGEGSSQTGGQ